MIRKVPNNSGGEITNMSPDDAIPEQPAPEAPVMTSRSTLEAADKVTTQTPPILDAAIAIEKANESAADDFMRTASKADLDRIRNLTEKDILTDAIVATDLGLPNFLDVQPKDPIYIF